MNPAVRKFLDSVSEVLDLMSFNGVECNQTLFFLSALTALFLTSFTTGIEVIVISLITSVVLTALSRELRTNLSKLLLALIYVVAFSLIALSPLIINDQLDLYLLYVFRALSATMLLIASTGILGWVGISNALRSLRLTALAQFIIIYVRMLSTLMKSTLKTLLYREARMFRKPDLEDLPTYSSLVGDLFLKGYSVGWRTSLAVSARTLTNSNAEYLKINFKLTKLDLFMVSIAIIEAMTLLLSGTTP